MLCFNFAVIQGKLIPHNFTELNGTYPHLNDTNAEVHQTWTENNNTNSSPPPLKSIHQHPHDDSQQISRFDHHQQQQQQQSSSTSASNYHIFVQRILKTSHHWSHRPRTVEIFYDEIAFRCFGKDLEEHKSYIFIGKSQLVLLFTSQVHVRGCLQDFPSPTVLAM